MCNNERIKIFTRVTPLKNDVIGGVYVMSVVVVVGSEC